ncbi:nucleoredoxin-like, partial [Gigantopelta aegis]|uniref:nucleoredoxin-like n=1 Tax=Gigantopelta aegis TaxID=1735272 RepID=UPI001B88DA13
MAEGGTVRPTLRDLFGDYVLKGDMLERIDIDKLGGDEKVIGVVLLARHFQPQLITVYEALKAKGEKFEIIFASSDRSEGMARLILEPISEAYHKTLDDRNAAKARKELIHFYFGSATSDDDVGEQLRQFAELPDQLPLVVILDVPNQSNAHWCPPCRVFTPNLIDWYTRLREGVAKDKLEIVYISLDKDEKTFDEYYETMPWLALPYKYRERE